MKRCRGSNHVSCQISGTYKDQQRKMFKHRGHGPLSLVSPRDLKLALCPHADNGLRRETEVRRLLRGARRDQPHLLRAAGAHQGRAQQGQGDGPPPTGPPDWPADPPRGRHDRGECKYKPLPSSNPFVFPVVQWSVPTHRSPSTLEARPAHHVSTQSMPGSRWVGGGW